MSRQLFLPYPSDLKQNRFPRPLYGDEYNLWQSTDVNNLEQIIRSALSATNLSLLGKQYVAYHKFLINGRWVEAKDLNVGMDAIEMESSAVY